MERREIGQGDLRVILVVELRFGDDAAEIGIPLPILRQENEVGPGSVQRMAWRQRQADLGANDRLDSLYSRRLHEAHSSIEAMMIRESQGRHAEGRRALNQTVGGRRSIKEAEIAVDMEMDHQS